jgi:hypothetical protein
VVASGRRTRLAEWSAENGQAAPRESVANSYMGYATQYVRIAHRDLDGLAGLSAGPFPSRHRGGVLLPADDGLHALTAIGVVGDYPPRDRDGFVEFLDAAPSPLLGEIARRAEPVSDIYVYRQDGSLRRHWEEADLPARLVVAGDAVSSFNPIYGQGIALAAIGGAILAKQLAAGVDLDEVAVVAQREIAEFADVAFGFSASADASFDGTDCVGYELASEKERAYSEALSELATVDPHVAFTLAQAGRLLKPSTLTEPSIRSRVHRWQADGGVLAPADPRSYPDMVHSGDWHVNDRGQRFLHG